MDYLCGNFFATLQVTEMILIKNATKFVIIFDVIIVFETTKSTVCSQGKID